MHPARLLASATLCTALVAASALPAVTLAASPAAAFQSTIATKANWKTRAINITVKAQNVPAGKSVTGYFVSENAAANPTGASTGWKTLPVNFTLADTEGAHTLYVWARTKTNVSLRGSVTTLLDRVAPTVSAFNVTPATTTSLTVPVTFTAADAGGANASGLSKYAVVNGTVVPPTGSAAWVNTQPTSVKLKAGNGVKTVSAFVRDAAGNVSAIASDTVALAVNAPTITMDITTPVKNKLLVPVFAKASGGSGGTYNYWLSTTNTTPAANAPGWKLVTSNFTFTGGDGVKTLYAWAKDGNGTVSLMTSDTYIYDATAPTATVTVTGNGTAGVTVTFSASSDGSGSGIDGYALVVGTSAPDASDDLAWYPTAADAAANLYIASGNGQTVTGFVKDLAKNVSAVNANSSKTVNKP